MTQPVAIDARRDGDADAHTIVAGIPLFVRVLRGLSRTDATDAIVFTRDREQSARVSRELADNPVKESLTISVEVADEGQDLGEHALLGWGLYERSALATAGSEAIEPQLRVESSADVRTAHRLLFASIRKTISLDGVIAYYAQRPLSRVITRLLVNTRISANQATLLSLSVGLLAAFFAMRGDRLGFALAGAGYFASGIFDCVDGDLARIRIEMSRLGEWLDSMTDELNTLSLLVGTGIGLYNGGADPMWLYACVGGAGLGTLALARQYLELHRLGGTVDTAQFPWFFRDEEDTTTTAATSPLGWVLLGFGYLIRRDANVTGISILLIVGLPKVAAGIIVGALLAVGLLTVVHFIVVAARGRSAG